MSDLARQKAHLDVFENHKFVVNLLRAGGSNELAGRNWPVNTLQTDPQKLPLVIGTEKTVSSSPNDPTTWTLLTAA